MNDFLISPYFRSLHLFQLIRLFCHSGKKFDSYPSLCESWRKLRWAFVHTWNMWARLSYLSEAARTTTSFDRYSSTCLSFVNKLFSFTWIALTNSWPLIFMKLESEIHLLLIILMKRRTLARYSNVTRS